MRTLNSAMILMVKEAKYEAARKHKLSLIHILRAHETDSYLVCRLLLEKKKKKKKEEKR